MSGSGGDAAGPSRRNGRPIERGLASPPGLVPDCADRLRDVGQVLLRRESGKRPQDLLFYGEALRAAAFALARWLEESDPGDVSPGDLRRALADAVSIDDTETVVEIVAALAWFHVAEAASYATAIDRERLLGGAFPALGWTREPPGEEDFLVRTILQHALVEDPERRWGSFFVAMCQLTQVPEEDIDRWLLKGASDELMVAVLDSWDQFEDRLRRVGLLEPCESTGEIRLVGVSWARGGS
jgi:hypothetical protein